jgi:D-cysteine desulfhydrase family pyridoxal phosphate-dependent enzyme
MGKHCLNSFPRAVIAHAPTPLKRLDSLSARLDGPTVWVKRDDCTGLAGGGNKIRKLEFLVGAAIEAGADVLITAGAIQSNHARQTAAVAARFHMRCILVLTDTVTGQGPVYRCSGNILLDRVLGAEINLVDGDAESGPLMGSIAERQRASGKLPFVIPIGGSNAIGTLGYVRGFLEMVAQFREHAISFDTVVLPTGSGGTQAGLLLGAGLSCWRGSVLGISVGALAERQRAKVEQCLRSAAELLGVEEPRAKGPSILIDDGFAGPGYGRPDAATIDAIRLTAETEGLLLDPVYSGKAMAGLIALIRADRFRRDQNVIFLHTGGAQALDAYSEHFA